MDWQRRHTYAHINTSIYILCTYGWFPVAKAERRERTVRDMERIEIEKYRDMYSNYFRFICTMCVCVWVCVRVSVCSTCVSSSYNITAGLNICHLFRQAWFECCCTILMLKQKMLIVFIYIFYTKWYDWYDDDSTTTTSWN